MGKDVPQYKNHLIFNVVTSLDFNPQYFCIFLLKILNLTVRRKIIMTKKKQRYEDTQILIFSTMTQRKHSKNSNHFERHKHETWTVQQKHKYSVWGEDLLLMKKGHEVF